MKKSELVEILTDLEINPDTISFYTTAEGESDDTEFGLCDLSGIEGDLVNCTALSHEGEFIDFQALNSLVHGHLGKLAGAF